MPAKTARNVYDARVREPIRATGNPDLFPELNIQWLHLNTLDTAAAVRRLVAFYATEHNEVLPHSALNGRTPDEVYFGQAESVPEELAAARKVARKERLAANRTLSCEAYVAPGPAASEEASAA